MRKPLMALILASAVVQSACVVYEPVPVQRSVAERFDRSWSAASGALVDQGVAITAQDRASGTVQGTRGGTTITATLTTLADGSIQVKFGTRGAEDPALIHRVSESYERRMGR